jgi:DNA polymerase
MSQVPKANILWLDFETISSCNLPVNGLQRYVEDTDTGVLCLGYAFDDDDDESWFPEDGPPPQAIIDHVNAGGILYAHNAQFDHAIWNYALANDFDVPAAPKSQWRCSATRATAHGLPGKLSDLCKALDLPLQKQTEGTRLINDYCCNGGQPWKEGDKALMDSYVRMDVKTMRQACSVLRELSDYEWSEYHRNMDINEFGIPVDVAFATAALTYAGDIKVDVDGQILALTGGAVATARARKARDAWVFPLLTDDQKELLSVHKDDEKKYSFDEEHRNNLLEAKGLDPRVETLLNLINDAGGSSTSKYKSIVNTHVDGRVFHTLVWHGAGTSRWTSRGLQLHNMPRKVFDNPDEHIDDVMGDYEIATPAKTLSRLLRATITSPDGITFGDWAAIEGRVCPWLSGDPRAQDVLDVFRRDEDIYVATAAAMGMDDRQAGKVAALSMQFAGGAGALQRMAKVYGVIYTDEEAEHLKTLWRNANAWCVQFWHGLHDAALSAFKNPGVVYDCGRLSFQFDGGDWLWMRRPSGNFHAYFQPRIELVTYPWGDEGYELTALAGSVKPKSGEPWPRRTLTPGILIENATQGTAADLLRDCVMRATDVPILFHCHDELIAEGDYREEIQALMDYVPEWAAGLPIKSEVKFAARYGK